MIKQLCNKVVVSALLFPFVALAQRRPPRSSGGTWNSSDLKGIFDDLTNIVNIVITFLIILATVIFLWGIVKYITAGGDEEKVKEARNLIIWGIVFLAVMVAVWGLVNIVLDFFGLGDIDNPEPIPDGPSQPRFP